MHLQVCEQLRMGSMDFPFPWHQSVHSSIFHFNRSHHRCRWATQLKSCLISEDSQTLVAFSADVWSSACVSSGVQRCSACGVHTCNNFSTYECLQYILNQIQQIRIKGELLLHDTHTRAEQNTVSRPGEHVGKHEKNIVQFIPLKFYLKHKMLNYFYNFKITQTYLLNK